MGQHLEEIQQMIENVKHKREVQKTYMKFHELLKEERDKEKVNTLKEKKRADEAEKRAAEAEKRAAEAMKKIEELEQLLYNKRTDGGVSQ